MNRLLTQRLITILCLMAFGLGQTLFTSIGVRCTDSSGKVRIELMCLKTSRGTCLSACTESAKHQTDDPHTDPAAQTPCEDEPLGSQVSPARVAPSSVPPEPVFVTVSLEVLWDRSPVACNCALRSFRSDRVRDRPPDSLARLRSVIRVV